MYSLVALATKTPDRKRYDDDSVDRLHNTTTVIILVVFAVVIVGQHYYGDPITCWAPPHFKGGWVKYTNNLCWVNDTYFLPFEEHIPKAHEIKKDQRIEYYQWMPFILLAQALFFFVPSQVWTAFNSKSGIDSDNILEAAYKLSRSTDPEKQTRLLVLLRNQIHYFVSNPRYGSRKSIWRKITNVICCVCALWSGSYLVVLYIIVKLLYVANVLMQLTMLNYVLKTDFTFFGLKWFMNDNEAALDEQKFLNNAVFPKVTMCDVYIRSLGNVNRYTLQCVLPVNMYAEKMYIFLWWWMVFILVCTLINLAVWVVRTLFSGDRVSYINNHLHSSGKLSGHNNPLNKKLTKLFTYSYLKQDGVFLFRMIGHNTNQLTVDDIIASVWENWREKQELTRDGITLLPKDNLFDAEPNRLNGNKPKRVIDLGPSNKPLPPKPGMLRAHSVPTAPPLKLNSGDSGSDNNFDI